MLDKTFAKRVQVYKFTGTLYVCRRVTNAGAIVAWAKSQGFKTTIDPDDMHVTIAYSKEELDWPPARKSHIELSPTQAGREVKRLGDKGAVVLCFNSKILTRRWHVLCGYGASWDYKEYTPHITISYRVPASFDLSKVKPYAGAIILGSEEFSEVDEDVKHVEKLHEALSTLRKHVPFSKALAHYHNVPSYKCGLVKADKSLGLIFGWAIISCEDGKPYYDIQGDHIPESSMLEASTDFMLNHRAMKVMHEGKKVGKVVFAWPMTEEIAQAMGIEGKRTGLMIAVKPDNPNVIQRFKDRKYTGFSIGGNRLVDEDVVE